MSGSTLNQYSKIISSINIPECNIMSTTFTCTDGGLYLVPSQNVINRNPDVTGLIVSASNNNGKLEFIEVDGLLSLGQLSDVTITNPQTNQVLTYNGIEWVNQTFTGGVTVPGEGSVWFSDATGAPIGDNTKLSWLTASQVLQLEGSIEFTAANGFFTISQSPTQLGDLSLILPPTVGTPGYVLTTDGAGTTSWTPKGSGSVTVPGEGSLWFSDATGAPQGDNTKLSWLTASQVLQLEGSIEFTAANGFFTISQSPTQLGDLSLILPATAGISGYVLTTDGTGITSWTPKGTVNLPDADYGDITVSNSGSTWTINDEAVTLQKIQNSDTAKIVGRNSPGNGELEFINRVSSSEIINGTETEIRGMSPADINSFIAIGVNDYVSKTELNLQTIVSPIELLDNTQSTGTSSGSLVVNGGVGINLDLFIGGEVNSIAYNTTSDKRKKKDIQKIEDPVGILSEIGAYSYILKDDIKCKKHYGVLAQELIGTKLEQSISHLEDGSMTVNYTDIIGVLIGAVNDLSKKIEYLTKK